jgi:hypothetical protein
MLQKYRADKQGVKSDNGSIPWYTNWMGGPSIALVRNCPCFINGENVTARSVYVRGDADTYFSIPAACRIKGKDVRGYLTADEKGFTFYGSTKK